MSRNYLIFGETLVKVAGGQVGTTDTELGLASEPISIAPQLYFHDLHVDDYGPNVPCDVLWMLADVRIRMTLVHFDYLVLRQCLQSSMGGGGGNSAAGAGTPLGATHALTLSSNNLLRLKLVSNNGQQTTWTFSAAYLVDSPWELKLGTNHSLVTLNWRAIPYSTLGQQSEVVSSGIATWSSPTG
jgi:hypothetical protein